MTFQSLSRSLLPRSIHAPYRSPLPLHHPSRAFPFPALPSIPVLPKSPLTIRKQSQVYINYPSCKLPYRLELRVCALSHSQVKKNVGIRTAQPSLPWWPESEGKGHLMALEGRCAPQRRVKKEREVMMFVKKICRGCRRVSFIIQFQFQFQSSLGISIHPVR